MTGTGECWAVAAAAEGVTNNEGAGAATYAGDIGAGDAKDSDSKAWNKHWYLTTVSNY